MPRVNQTDFAKLVGVSEAVIRRGIKRGRVSKGPDGLIDTDTEIARWHATRDQTKDRQAGRPATASTPEASRQAVQSFDKLKTAKVALEVQLLQEELKKVRSDSISKDVVRRDLASFARLQSTKWTNFPNRYGLEIAAELGAEPKAVMAVLDRMIRLQLDEIANLKPTLTE